MEHQADYCLARGRFRAFHIEHGQFLAHQEKFHYSAKAAEDADNSFLVDLQHFASYRLLVGLVLFPGVLSRCGKRQPFDEWSESTVPNVVVEEADDQTIPGLCVAVLFSRIHRN